MKRVIIALLLVLPGMIYAQSDSLKLPKLYVTEKTFSIGFELGDKEVSYNDVAPHLKLHNTEAYYLWRRQESNTVTSLVFSTIALAGGITGLVTKNDQLKGVAFSLALSSFAGSLLFDSAAKNKRTKAVSIYNKAAGY